MTHPQPSVLPNKWRFDISQDYQTLKDNFDIINLDTILNDILQALGFHLSPLDYCKKRVPQFVNITDKPKLVIKPKPIDNGQPITDSKNQKVWKRLECAIKNKAQYDNPQTSVQAPATGFAANLLFCFRSSTLLLSCHISVLLSCFG